MRVYRESFEQEDGHRGLTQGELLERMGEVDSSYARRYSHATVSRWESGATRPTAQRLRVFGRALNLSEVEVRGLVRMAGLDGDLEAHLPAGGDPADDGGETAPAVPVEPSPGGVDLVFLRSVFRLGVLRCLPLALWTAGLGYLLAFVGWDGAWGPVAYVGLVIAPVLAQGLLLPGRDAGLREFFWVSVFLLLTTPLVQFSPLGMDHYGFHVRGDLGGTQMPYMLSLLLNLGIAGAAGLVFDLLGNWQYRSSGGADSALGRACWTVLPPVILVYTAVAVITNVSVSIQLAVLFPVLAVLVALMLVSRDPLVRVSDQDRRLLLQGLLGAAMVSVPLGVFTVMAIYLSPDMPMVLPDHNLLGSWELDFEALGYSRQEALDRLDLGYMWHAMSIFAYMVFVVGGNVVVSVGRMGGQDGGVTAVSAPGTSGPGGSGPERPSGFFGFSHDRGLFWVPVTGPVPLPEGSSQEG